MLYSGNSFFNTIHAGGGYVREGFRYGFTEIEDGWRMSVPTFVGYTFRKVARDYVFYVQTGNFCWISQFSFEPSLEPILYSQLWTLRQDFKPMLSKVFAQF